LALALFQFLPNHHARQPHARTAPIGIGHRRRKMARASIWLFAEFNTPSVFFTRRDRIWHTLLNYTLVTNYFYIILFIVMNLIISEHFWIQIQPCQIYITKLTKWWVNYWSKIVKFEYCYTCTSYKQEWTEYLLTFFNTKSLTAHWYITRFKITDHLTSLIRRTSKFEVKNQTTYNLELEE
jgi:hypothetical protein